MKNKFNLGDNYKTFAGISNTEYDRWHNGQIDNINGVNNHDWADAFDSNRYLRQVAKTSESIANAAKELMIAGMRQKIMAGCELYDEGFDWRSPATSIDRPTVETRNLITITAVGTGYTTCYISGPGVEIPEGTYIVEVTTTGAWGGAGRVTCYYTDPVTGATTVCKIPAAVNSGVPFSLHKDFRNDLFVTLVDLKSEVLTAGDYWVIVYPKKSVPFVTPRQVPYGTSPPDLDTFECTTNALTLTDGILSGHEFIPSLYSPERNGDFIEIKTDEQAFLSIASKAMVLDYYETTATKGECGFGCVGIIAGGATVTGLDVFPLPTTYEFDLLLEGYSAPAQRTIQLNLTANTVQDVIDAMQTTIDGTFSASAVTVSLSTFNDIIITYNTAAKKVYILDTTGGGTNLLDFVGPVSFGPNYVAQATQKNPAYIDTLELKEFYVNDPAIVVLNGTVKIDCYGKYGRKVPGIYRVISTNPLAGGDYGNFSVDFSTDNGSTWTAIGTIASANDSTPYPLDINYPDDLTVVFRQIDINPAALPSIPVIGDTWDIIIDRYYCNIDRRANGDSTDTERRMLNQNSISTGNRFNYIEDFYDMVTDTISDAGVHDFTGGGAVDLTDILYTRLNTRIVTKAATLADYTWNYIIFNKAANRIECWYSQDISAYQTISNVDTVGAKFKGTDVPGLATLANYTLDITEDGVTYNLNNISINILDDWDDVAAAIQTSLTGFGGSGTVEIVEGKIKVSSATSGSASSITIAASGVGNDLIVLIDALAGYLTNIDTMVPSDEFDAPYAAATRLTTLPKIDSYFTPETGVQQNYILLYSVAVDNAGAILAIVNEDSSSSFPTSTCTIFTVADAAARIILAGSGVPVLGDRCYQVDTGEWYNWDGFNFVIDL